MSLSLPLEVFAVFFVGMLPFMLSAFPDRYALANRQLSNTELLLGNWTRALGVVALVLYVASRQPSGVASLALHAHDTQGNTTAVAVGVIVLALFLVLLTFATRLFRRKTAPTPPGTANEDRPQLQDVARYRRLPERIAFLSLLAFLVLAEDLVSRGYLVYLLGTRLGNFVPGIIISLAFTVMAHLYQGRNARFMAWHILLGAIFIFLLMLTGNLLAVIVGHLYYDILFAIGRWRVLDRQAPQEAVPSFTLFEKIFYPAFILFNVCVLGVFIYMAGFFSLSF